MEVVGIYDRVPDNHLADKLNWGCWWDLKSLVMFRNGLFVRHDQSELVSCRLTRSLVGPRLGEEISIPTFWFAGLP